MIAVTTRHALILASLHREAEAIRRDMRIVQLHEEGLSNVEIAERMGLSRHTVRDVVRNRGLRCHAQDSMYFRGDSRTAKASDRSGRIGPNTPDGKGGR